MTNDEIEKFKRLISEIEQYKHGNTNVTLVIQDDRGFNVYGFGDEADSIAYASMALGLGKNIIFNTIMASNEPQELIESDEDGKFTIH